MSGKRIVEMPAGHRAVLLVAGAISKAARKRWWRREPSWVGFVPAAKEAVGVLLWTPEGREMVREVLSDYTEGTP